MCSDSRFVTWVHTRSGALALGLAGLVGLAINGFWKATPFIRTASAFGRAFLWLQIHFGIYASGTPSTGTVVYLGLVSLEIWNIYRAMGDARTALDERLAAAGVPGELRQSARGRDVAEELAAVIAETSAELLVIGIRHRSAVGKLLMGSAAQRILLDVDCPVLAVKSPPHPQPAR